MPSGFGSLFGLPTGEIAVALAALEAEGFAFRGRFLAVDEDQWCERRLLARVHRYTIKRLRAEIEPVAARDFLRFLLSWQRVAADARIEGPEAIEAVVEQLEGFAAPAASCGHASLPAPAPARKRVPAVSHQCARHRSCCSPGAT